MRERVKPSHHHRFEKYLGSLNKLLSEIRKYEPSAEIRIVNSSESVLLIIDGELANSMATPWGKNE